jgi:translation initiation factor 3 subunit B
VACSDDDEILQNEDPPEVEMGFANTIVVDNLPVVPPEKFEKLGNYGYCFIEYNTPQVVCFCQSLLFSYLCS